MLTTPFADTYVKARTECDFCFAFVLEAVSTNGKTMLMDLDPVTKDVKGSTGWELGLVVHDGETKLQASFLDPFQRSLLLDKGSRRVHTCHFDTCPHREAREEAKRRHPSNGRAS